MCGRFTLTQKSAEELEGLLDIPIPKALAENYRPRYNVAPTQTHWIYYTYENEIRIEPSVWGLVPSWSKDGKGFINARSETVAEKPSFRSAFKSRRCLVPADGYYEWKPENGKQPYWFHLPKHKPFLFAGLYEEPNSFSKEKTFTLLTRTAEGEMRSIHDRMPVILSKENAKKWISANIPSTDLMQDEVWKKISMIPVTKRVNSPSIDDPSCLNSSNDLTSPSP